MKPFIETITPQGFLSFGPEATPIHLQPLNVLIGANGSGKSNLIELVEFLRAAPTGLASAVREGGSGIAEYLWKGDTVSRHGSISAICNVPGIADPLRYKIALAPVAERLEVVDEVLEECVPRTRRDTDVYFFYRFQDGRPVINTRQSDGKVVERALRRESIVPFESVLSQRRDPDLYPELTAIANQFSMISTYREWSIGRYAPLRRAQSASEPNDRLKPDARNLALVLNSIEHTGQWIRLKAYLRRFLPRFSDLTTLINAGTVQVYLHEEGLSSPIPATRLSDGTIRFIALLAILLRPEATPLICLEEPELGLHPDALSLVAELLLEASATTQLIVTTQSDALISRLSDNVDSVIVCENLRGRSSLRRLEREQLAHWLENYTLGDIWKIGEIGGNP